MLWLSNEGKGYQQHICVGNLRLVADRNNQCSSEESEAVVSELGDHCRCAWPGDDG